VIDLWYKDAVLYSLDVDSFQDSDGDGIGDFRGLGERLDYLSSLGVTCLWLLPFYPSPNRDNGYDVMDYYGVDPRLGSLGDFVELMHKARERGIRVLVDLVVNHTSDQHPWFQAARQSKDSPYRDYYLWSDTLPENAHEGMVFPGYQDAVWDWDEAAQAYYFHRFYAHQPDLNISNPAVRQEICKIMGFWLELGVSGFRVDAAPFLIEMKGAAARPGEDHYDYLREFRDFLSWRRGDAILLAEANVSRDKVSEYFSDDARIQMLFSFLLNQHLFLALARQQAEPLVRGMRLAPVPPLVRTRKQCPEIGWGTWEILETGDPGVFAHRCTWSGGTVVAVHNLAGRPAAVRLDLKEQHEEKLVELLGDQPYKLVEVGAQIDLEPYGYRWFRIGGARRFLF
jgi:maltose alpha-D-glucosyltransferase/alpha-amylase